MPIEIGGLRPVNKDFGIVEALPTSNLAPGVTCTYKATNGIYWRFIYTGEAELPWASIGQGVPLAAEVEAQQGTKSATPTGLATAGPSITVPLKGDYDVEIVAQQYAGVTNAWMSYKVGAATALAADGIQSAGNNASVIWGGPRRKRKTGLAAGTVLLAQYWNEGGGTIETLFGFRQMRVYPVRVG